MTYFCRHGITLTLWHTFGCLDVFVTSCLTFWRHYVFCTHIWRHNITLMSWSNFWHHDVPLTSRCNFDVMPYFLMSWLDFVTVTLTSWCNFDGFYVMTYFLTPWRTLDVMVLLYPHYPWMFFFEAWTMKNKKSWHTFNVIPPF